MSKLNTKEMLFLTTALLVVAIGVILRQSLPRHLGSTGAQAIEQSVEGKGHSATVHLREQTGRCGYCCRDSWGNGTSKTAGTSN